MDYHAIFREIQPHLFVWGYLKWTLIALLASLVLLVICARLRLFKRQTPIARILVKAYYLFIPAYFLIFAFQVAPLLTAQKVLHRSVEAHEAEITAFTSEFLNNLQEHGQDTDQSLETITRSFLDVHFEAHNTAENAMKTRVKAHLYRLKKKILIGYLTRVVEKHFIKTASGWTGISEKAGEDLYRTSFADLFGKGELVNIIHTEIRQVFGSILKPLILLFFLGLLVPAAEIITSKILKY